MASPHIAIQAVQVAPGSSRSPGGVVDPHASGGLTSPMAAAAYRMAAAAVGPVAPGGGGMSTRTPPAPFLAAVVSQPSRSHSVQGAVRPAAGGLPIGQVPVPPTTSYVAGPVLPMQVAQQSPRPPSVTAAQRLETQPVLSTGPSSAPGLGAAMRTASPRAPPPHVAQPGLASGGGGGARSSTASSLTAAPPPSAGTGPGHTTVSSFNGACRPLTISIHTAGIRAPAAAGTASLLPSAVVTGGAVERHHHHTASSTSLGAASSHSAPSVRHAEMQPQRIPSSPRPGTSVHSARERRPHPSIDVGDAASGYVEVGGVQLSPMPQEVPLPWKAPGSAAATAREERPRTDSMRSAHEHDDLGQGLGWTPSFDSISSIDDVRKRGAPATSSTATGTSPRRPSSGMPPPAPSQARSRLSGTASKEGSPRAGSRAQDAGRSNDRPVVFSAASLPDARDIEDSSPASAASGASGGRFSKEQQQRLKEAELAAASVGRELEVVTGQRDQLQKQLQEQRRRKEDLEKDLSRQQEATEVLRDELSDMRREKARLAADVKREREKRYTAERLAEELSQKARQLQDELTSLARSRIAEADVPSSLQATLDKMAKQLDETARAVSLQRNDYASNGDAVGRRVTSPAAMQEYYFSPTSGEAARQQSHTPPIKQLSPEALSQLEEASKLSPWKVGDKDQESTATQEEELPTAEEQLLGGWSTTSLQDSSNGFAGDATLASLVDGLEGTKEPERLPNPTRNAGKTSSLTAPISQQGQLAAQNSPVTPDRDEGAVVERMDSRQRGTGTLNLRDLSEIKALKKPPTPVRMLMEVCCLLFHIQPVRQADERCVKRWRMDYWEPARRYLLSDSFFLSKLRNYDEELTPAQLSKISKYFQDPEFTEDRVQQCSRAAHELYCWIWLLMQKQKQLLQESRKRQSLGGGEAATSALEATDSCLPPVVESGPDALEGGVAG
eukprot:TRINITY_DN49397_c0_g2_i1.p1 TRINITY_DN49397_c0_g2~~TRINITY_DN49397_c0_g2_i1.p1  ORF type:complete len:955 (+),score=261.96 TRINITY_DN49397_c0_g2_i1:207-3071(+)